MTYTVGKPVTVKSDKEEGKWKYIQQNSMERLQRIENKKYKNKYSFIDFNFFEAIFVWKFIFYGMGIKTLLLTLYSLWTLNLFFPFSLSLFSFLYF